MPIGIVFYLITLVIGMGYFLMFFYAIIMLGYPRWVMWLLRSPEDERGEVTLAKHLASVVAWFIITGAIAAVLSLIK